MEKYIEIFLKCAATLATAGDFVELNQLVNNIVRLSKEIKQDVENLVKDGRLINEANNHATSLQNITNTLYGLFQAPNPDWDSIRVVYENFAKQFEALNSYMTEPILNRWLTDIAVYIKENPSVQVRAPTEYKPKKELRRTLVRMGEILKRIR